MDSVRGTALLQFGELVGQYGASARDYLAPHHIPMDVIGDYEKKLSYKRMVQMFEGVAHAMNMPGFGLELATRQGSRLLGPLHHLARSSATVGDGLDAVIRYMRVYSPSIHATLEHEKPSRRTLLRFENNLPNSLEIPQIIEKSVLQGCLLVSELLGAPYRPQVVLFRHNPLASLAQYWRYFACPVLFGQDFNAVAMAPEDLDKPCAHHDPILHSVVRFYLDAHLDSTPNLAAEVDRQIRAFLPLQRANLEQVAQALGMNSRTLQRRLADAGLDFGQQLDRMRRHLAQQLLAGSALTISQIAKELGYRCATSFCRAHQRWFDMTPQEHRLRSRT
ncbi:AraC family transcriptional regulator [Zestomonas carbonaria]|uniref:HTH-type transcriptional regulator VirS n=1 Tax=Zestomonas carbonaria TaxID=2762745 RepID=A0A7U7ES88_9GAMM|nr:AraC family transcriptional regulator [Pseudomonas carbonaria]CAD5109280.1 HTH-type transcriptional regulator VirS [Pseudomonas carbonaria]